MFGISQRKFSTTELSDARLRTVAELVDERVGKRGDRIVTEHHLEKAARLLSKHASRVAAGRAADSPLADLLLPEVRLLQEGLPELQAFLRAAPRTSAPRPACTSLAIEAVADTRTRACAEALARAFRPEAAELNLRDLLTAKEILATLRADPGATQRSTPAERLAAAVAAGIVTDAEVDKIDVFMLSGKGGLVSHGPVRINGREFPDLYRLPCDAAVLAPGKSRELADVIDGYETRFLRCGYDRIYIRGFDGKLYVALNDKGSLDKIGPAYRVQMRTDRHLADSGEVLRVVDVNNSFGEATWSYWRKVTEKLVSRLRAALLGKVDRAIEDAAKRAVADAPVEGRSAKLDLKDILVTGGLLTGLGAAAAFLPVAVKLVAGSAGVATVANVVEYLTVGHDKAPILHAVGVTVNRTERLRY